MLTCSLKLLRTLTSTRTCLKWSLSSSKHHKYCLGCLPHNWAIQDREVTGHGGQCIRFIHSSCTSKMAVRIFEGKEHAALYAQYRPTYPGVVYETIKAYYEEGKGPTCNFDLAIDVGCGSGQSTRPLTKYFQHVTGTDVSAEQVANANSGDTARVQYRQGVAEDLGFLASSSVDLVTVGQAYHWFDRGVFLEEVSRVLKPGGVLAVYGYGMPGVDNDEAQALFMQFHDDLLGTYWDEGRRYVVTMYRDFSLPYPGWKRLDGWLEGGELEIRRCMPVDAYLGYLSTFSAWRKYLVQHPQSQHLHDMKRRLLELYQVEAGSEAPVITVTWPIYMLLGRKPS